MQDAVKIVSTFNLQILHSGGMQACNRAGTGTNMPYETIIIIYVHSKDDEESASSSERNQERKIGKS